MGVGDYDVSLSWKLRKGYTAAGFHDRSFCTLKIVVVGDKNIGNDVW
jgi:hypothetical protein